MPQPHAQPLKGHPVLPILTLCVVCPANCCQGNDCAFVQKKKAMLEQEGIAFNGASVASPEAILHEDQLRKLLQE